MSWSTSIDYLRAAYVCNHPDVLKETEDELVTRTKNVHLCSLRDYTLCVDRIAWLIRCSRLHHRVDEDAFLGFMFIAFLILLFWCLR